MRSLVAAGVVRAGGALAGAALRRRPRTGDPRAVRFLLANAWSMGGTVRTTLTIAGALSADRPVEVVSVMRHRDEPFFAFPDAVRVTVIDDLRPERRRGRLEWLLRRAPSVLLPRHDARMARHWTLWTDLALVRWAWRVREGVLVTTRPGLNLVAPTLRGGGVRLLAQEHLNRAAHPEQRLSAMQRRYPHLDGLIVLTDADAEDYRRALPGGPPVTVVPNGVPPGAQTGGMDSTEILAAGRLTRQKGFDLLVEAFARVAGPHPAWRLRILGDGPQHARLRRLAAKHGIAERVALPGRSADLQGDLRRAGIFVLSSRFEGLPVVLLEAMAAGMAVAAFDCPTGPREVIEPDRSGLLVAPEDVDALAASIAVLIEDPARRRALGRAARERIEDAFSTRAATARWNALLDGLSSSSSSERHRASPR